MREERDSLGTLQLPEDVYYGIQTLRAVENYPISGITIHPAFIRAYASLKRACLHANVTTGAFTDEAKSRAIAQACDEVIKGKLDDQFVIDVFQAGAGTSTNMNFNEVIANRALEIMQSERGKYDVISPNDHVNMSQSTNDTYPTAMRIACVIMLHEKLYPCVEALEQSFMRKAKEFDELVKSARTHLQDAVPMTLGQEFGAWSVMMKRHRERLEQAERDIKQLGIGGSAAGTGLNTPRGYREAVVAKLNEMYAAGFTPSEDLFEAMQSLAPFVHLASAMKNLALDLFKISSDLRLLSSGPMTGFAEIMLPAVQPGSSIMPGKVNPSILEMVSQVCLQIVGVEAVVAMASQAGHLELNVMMPVVQHNLTFGLEILSNMMGVMKSRCIDGITADEERMRFYAETSASLVTALAPKIGYLEAAAIAKESLASRRRITDIVLERKLMSAEELEATLDLYKMAKPHGK
jgi:aspartate ammonia-lyase